MKKSILLFILLSLSFLSRAQTFTWNGTQQILDLQTVNIPIVVSGLPTAIDTNFGLAHICMNITHTYDADLIIKLISPSGDSVTLIQGIGGSGDNFMGTCVGVDGTFFSNASAPYSGIFQPIGNTALFNNGQNPNGTWILRIRDNAAADTGSVHQASIVFVNNPPRFGGGGSAITGTYYWPGVVCPGGASFCDLLPDMTASAKEIQLNHNETPGALYISNATPNIGYGPLEIYGVDTCFCGLTQVPCNTICPPGIELEQKIMQRVYKKLPGIDSLSYFDRPAGVMSFHPSHGHLHVDNFANYTLRTATSNPDATTWPIVGTGTKQSFCLINLGNCPGNVGECRNGNNGPIVTTVPNQNLGFHTGCGLTQGIYPGNYDVYSISLNDPIPLVNVCNGTYYIVSITDPDNNFLESDETNNWVAVPITLTQQNAGPVITASGPTTICAGDSVILSANTASNYLWSTGATTQSIVVHTSGTYTVSSDCGTTIATSTPVTVSVLPSGASPSVTIAISSGTNPPCNNVPVTFTATTTNAGSSPSYVWKVNGAVVGGNNSTYTSTTLSAGQVVTCEMTSSLACLTSTSAVSNSITISSGTPLCYCLPVWGTTANSGCLDGDLIARVQLNTLDNNSGASCTSGINGYVDYSASSNPLHTTSLQLGGNYTLTVTAGQYGEGYKAWIDYNNDGVFASTEAIGNTTAVVPGSGQVGVAGSSAGFPVHISCAATLGPHRMRVRCMYNNTGASIDPCIFQNNYGEAEDYTITLIAPTSCPSPSNLTATSITSGSAVLGWQAGCLETLWNVHITSVGGGAPGGAPSHPAVTNPLSVSGLTAGTSYEFWVAANCLGTTGVKSTWSGPFVFTTSPNCATMPGSSMANPIQVGQAPCVSLPFTNIQTNTTQNCFTNSYTGTANQSAPDVWYRFTLSAPATVQISHCGSGFDTYLHLLNSSGSQLQGNDDNGPLCAGLQASISASLAAGTYYVVSEGYGANTGTITTRINTTTVCPVNSVLNLTCFIQGYWNGSNGLAPVLSNQGLNAIANACDSITVQLRAATAPYNVVQSTKSLLMQNGTATCTFPYVTGNYYIVVKHRNALETWSAAPVSFSSQTVSYNFSTDINKAYGSNQFQLSNGAWSFFSGDLNTDENIDLLDANIVEMGITNFLFGYYPSDLNGDGNVDLLDNPVLETNITNYVFSVHP